MPAAASLFLQRTVLPPAGFVDAAAAAIVAAEKARVPDLTHALVLVPELHAAADVARALRRAAGVPALLLPRITTLGLWAAEVPLAQAVVPRVAREALLYRELADRTWLQPGDLWAIAGELAGLFGELTRQNLSLPRTLAEFNRQLARAYGAKSGSSLGFEARLVHELWNVLSRARDEVDTEAAYQLRLARRAGDAAAPLYTLGLGNLSASEERFLERYAERAAVCVFTMDGRAASDAVTRTLCAAWTRGPQRAGLRDRAHALKAGLPGSPLSGKLRIVGVGNAEQEAQAVDVTVRQWLLDGRRRIAIVVHDRVVARRARALLERAQVLVKDEAGWAFSTTSAATAIGRWLDVAGGDCYHRDLLDFLKSPFAFHDWPREQRRQAVLRLERYVREESVISGLGNFIGLAESRNDAELRQLLARLRTGEAALGRGSRTIPRWLASLVASLREIGVADGLAADAAGEQLLDLFDCLTRDLEGDPLRVEFGEWRRWLARQLEAATFRDRALESPVVFTTLGATQLRSFDAVLILGADAAHLPGPDPVSPFFNQGVRAELGLSTWAERVHEIEDQLGALIASTDTTVVTWQSMLGGDENLLAPAFERLDALHRLAWTSGLEDSTLASRLPLAEVRNAGAQTEVAPTTRPAPVLPSRLVQPGISATGYNSLVACPYQYFARYPLGLAELDDVQEALEKRDYGSIVHGVLTEFHGLYPRVSILEPAAAESELVRLSEAAFADVVKRNYFARAWLERWKGLVPVYIQWQRRWEGEGWSWKAGEVKRALELTTPQGRRLTLHGRLDRIDVKSGDESRVTNHETASDRATNFPLPLRRPFRASPGVASPETGAPAQPLDAPHLLAVIDYKTRSVKALEESLKLPGEDVQLAVYTLLAGDPVARALFLSVDRREVEAIEMDEEVGEMAGATRARLLTMFDALAEGARLRAQGVEAACEYCDVRGLCRKGYWHE